MTGSVARRWRRFALLAATGVTCATTGFTCAIAGFHAPPGEVGQGERRCARQGHDARPVDRDGVLAYYVRVLP
ncbi:MAG: hypothetical protein HOV94_36410 [Saccharothrix sp.]|nr:hypothetical protein [Saccharothrix sp.]